MIVSNINWVLQPKIEKKKKPMCQVCMECNLCGQEIYKDFNFEYGDVHDDQHKEYISGMIHALIDDHFHLDEDTGTEKRCKGLKGEYLSQLTEARDKEWIHVGHIEQLKEVEKQLFEKLMQMVWHVHYEMIPIINSVSWNTYSRCSEGTRTKRQPRLASIIPLNAKRQQTLEAVMGNNDSANRKQIEANTKASASSSSLRKKCKAWEDFMDDLVFLKHLDKIAYMNVKEDKSFITNILPYMKNNNVYNDTQDIYFVGFPVHLKQNEFSTITENTPFYDQNTVGTVRFLDERWVTKFCPTPFILNIKSSVGRKMTIPLFTKNLIQQEMGELRKIHCTHVYKYHCKISMAQKFCNVVMTKKTIHNDIPYEIMKADNITKNWLYETVVGLHGCEAWYRDVMDPKKTDKVFPLPVASVAKICPYVPKKIDNAPKITYPQKGEGSCGVSAFSSSFSYMFDQDLGAKIYSRKKDYMKSLGQQVEKKSRKATSLIFLSELVRSRAFKDYYVYRITKSVS